MGSDTGKVDFLDKFRYHVVSLLKKSLILSQF